jgi:hypothetical protein
MVGHRGLRMLVTAAAVVLAALMFAMALALMPFLMAFAVAAVVLLTFFVVVAAAALVLREGVVVLAALHAGSGKTVPELNAADAGDGEYGMGNQGFHTVPEGFTQADGKALHRAFHNSTQGITLSLGGFEGVRPGGGVGKTAYLAQLCVELGKIEHFLGDDTRRHYAQRNAAAEVAAAAGVVEAAELEVGGEIGVARAGMFTETLVVFAAGVLVAEKDGERRACGVPLIYAGDNLGEVVLYAGRGTQGSGLATPEVCGEVLFTQGNPGKDTVYGDTDARAVRLSEYADSEFITKCIHNFSNNSLKWGNDLATQVTSSMTTGLSAPREATWRAITMRWSAWEA